VAVAPFPDPRELEADEDEAAGRALAALDELHRHELPAERTACYLVEPVQGLGGCRPAGAAFLRGLRRRADRHGALLVLDEVQTGMGRTGRPFASQLFGVAPDVLCLGKALGAGFPIAAVGVADRLADALDGCVRGSTFSGSPVSCAAACAGIDVLRDEGLCDRARDLGAAATRRLRGVAQGLPVGARVRGPGLMIGLELSDRGGGRPRPDLVAAVIARCRRDGVLAMASGRDGEVIRILPPLVIGRDDLERALDVLERALAGALARRRDAYAGRPGAGNSRTDWRRSASTPAMISAAISSVPHSRRPVSRGDQRMARSSTSATAANTAAG
jgi:4-aminobutyrate aminotransferase